MDRLTPRETEVLGLVGRCLDNAEIAVGLVLSEETVKTHVNRAMYKLGLRSRAQAVVIAYESGLVRPGSGTRREVAPRGGDLLSVMGRIRRRRARGR